jgi:ribosomal protein S18 acetylase RimI-like enzyme
MASVQAGLKIRQATIADISFLARIQYESFLTPAGYCFWDDILIGMNTSSLQLIEAMFNADASNWGYATDFWILEEQRIPIAAAGYTPYSEDYRLLNLSKTEAIAAVLDWSSEMMNAFSDRYQQLWGNDPQPIYLQPQADWMIESVAVLPEGRGRGLGKMLLKAVLEEGRSRGYAASGIAIINGNEVARHTYESLGFQPYASFYAEYFEGAFPGFTKFRMTLN